MAASFFICNSSELRGAECLTQPIRDFISAANAQTSGCEAAFGELDSPTLNGYFDFWLHVDPGPPRLSGRLLGVQPLESTLTNP